MAVHGTFPTDRPERYAKQLAGHWADKGTINETDDGLRLTMRRSGVAVLRPEPGAPRIGAETPEFGQVVTAQFERFTQRDGIVLTREA